MFRYVTVDENGYPVEDFWFTDEVEEAGKIPIPADFNLTNKRYSNGEWIDVIPFPIWETDLIDETTEANLEMQMNMQYLVDLAEINMEEM